MNDLLPWVPHVIAAAALAYAVFNNRGRKHEKKMSDIEQSVAAVNNGIVTMQRTIEGRVDKIEDRVTKVEGEVTHLPDKEVTHRLELAMARFEGELGRMSERMKPLGAMADRIQDAVLARVEAQVR
jgi:hypothetical protein